MPNYDDIFDREQKDESRLLELIRTELSKLRFQGIGGITVSAKDGRIIISGSQPSQTVQVSQNSVAMNPGGAFFRIFEDGGDQWLQGGTVTGGTGSITVPNIDITSLSDGHSVWLSCGWTRLVSDSVLMPGGSLSSATASSGATIPASTLPTEASNGTAIIPLASKLAGTIVPSAAGNILLYFPIYGFTWRRG